tara:strand:- start:39 stop:140 length:102 start_codon:yes stop_codon:yes gene_type:complete
MQDNRAKQKAYIIEKRFMGRLLFYLDKKWGVFL